MQPKIFDHNAFLDFSEENGVADLERSLQRCGIAGAFVSSLEAVRSSLPTAGNARLAKKLDGCANLVPLPVCNPLESPEEHLATPRAFSEGGMIRLAPAYHGYALTDHRLAQWLESIAPSKVFITMQLRDPRNQRTGTIVPDVSVEGLAVLAQKFPKMDFIANALSRAAILRILSENGECANLYADCTLLDGADAWDDWASFCSKGKILFGSGYPIHYPESARLKFEVWGQASPLLRNQLRDKVLTR